VCRFNRPKQIFQEVREFAKKISQSVFAFLATTFASFAVQSFFDVGNCPCAVISASFLAARLTHTATP